MAVQSAVPGKESSMRGKIALVGVVTLFGFVFGLAPVESASATGGADVQFRVSGTLPEFPCEDGCPVTFDGRGTGGGQVTFEADGVTHIAEFTIFLGEVSGSAEYSEPGFPLCPLFGSANSPTTGSVTLSGGSTGIIHRVQTGPTLPGGTVSEASFTLDFNYQRVGATPVIEITGGSVTLAYFIPGFGPGTHTESIVAGEGTGVFEVDPIEAAARCMDPGSLDFELIGDAAIVTD